MNLRHCLYPLVFAAIISGCAATAAPYGAPPDTSDPWELIHHARGWLQQGRPRGALPSLKKALVEVERLGHETADGYGADGERFLREVAAPRIHARALRIG